MKKLLLFTFIFLMFSNPASAFFGGISFDPVAKVQRAIMMVEQKIQTFKAFQMIQETIKNVKMAERMYDMALRGYDRLTNISSDEWKSLEQFAKRRFSNMLNPDELDPHDSALGRAFSSFDRGLDDWTETILTSNKLMDYLDEQNRVSGDALSNSVVGRFASGTLSSVESKAESFRKKANPTYRAAIKQAERDLEQMEQEAEKLARENESLIAEDKEVRRAYQNAWDGFMRAQFELDAAHASGEAQNLLNRLTIAKTNLDNIKESLDRVNEKKTELAGRSNELATVAVKKKASLKAVMEFAAMQGFLKEKWLSLSVSSSANMELYVRGVQSVFFGLLVVTFALGIMWYGLTAYKGNSSFEMGHDVVMGLIAGFIFLWPASPLSLHRLVRPIAIVTDGVTGLIAARSGDPFKALDNITDLTGQWLTEENAKVEKRSAPNGNYISQKWNSAKEAVETVSNIGKAGLFTMLYTSIAWIISLAGTIAVYVSLLLRNLFFWFLMMFAPACIFVAPLEWGRKTLIPNWGQALYGTILWGPTVYILLMIIGMMTGQAGEAASYGRGMDQFSAFGNVKIFVACFNGLLLALAMCASPFIVFSITQGSFGGVTSAMATGMTSAATVGVGAAAAATGMGMRATGSTMSGVGKMMGGSAGGFNGSPLSSATNRPVGPAGYQSSGSSGRSGKGGGRMATLGSALCKTGNGISSVGKLVSQSGNNTLKDWKTPIGMKLGQLIPEKKPPMPQNKPEPRGNL